MEGGHGASVVLLLFLPHVNAFAELIHSESVISLWGFMSHVICEHTISHDSYSDSLARARDIGELTSPWVYAAPHTSINGSLQVIHLLKCVDLGDPF